MSFSAPSTYFLNISRVGGTTTSLGSLFQCLTIHFEKKFSQYPVMSSAVSLQEQLKPAAGPPQQHPTNKTLARKQKCRISNLTLHEDEAASLVESVEEKCSTYVQSQILKKMVQSFELKHNDDSLKLSEASCTLYSVKM